MTNIGDGWVKKNPAAKAAWDELVPVGRMAETYQIKPLALLLASDAGSYMTGSARDDRRRDAIGAGEAFQYTARHCERSEAIQASGWPL